MRDGEFLVLTGAEVESLLAGQESKLIEIVRAAYEAHCRDRKSVV